MHSNRLICSLLKKNGLWSWPWGWGWFNLHDSLWWWYNQWKHQDMGVSLNGGTPISHRKCWSFLVGKTHKKPMVVGETHHLRKRSYKDMFEGFAASWGCILGGIGGFFNNSWCRQLVVEPTPFEKICASQIGSFPQFLWWKTKSLQPPTSFLFPWWNDLAKLYYFTMEFPWFFWGISFPKPPPFLGAESSGEFPPCFPNKKATQVPRTCSRYHLPRALDFSRRYPPLTIPRP